MAIEGGADGMQANFERPIMYRMARLDCEKGPLVSDQGPEQELAEVMKRPYAIYGLDAHNVMRER